MLTKCFKIIKLTILLSLCFNFVLSDIRIDNNELSAEGHWEIRLNEDEKNNVVNKN